MPAGQEPGKGKNKGASTWHGGKSQGKSQNKSWRPPPPSQEPGVDNANKAEGAGSGSPEQDDRQKTHQLETEAKELKAKLMGSSMCKNNTDDEVVDLDADERQAALDQKIVERQARFGRDSDGAHAKSSVVIKRTSSSGTATSTSPNTPIGEASLSAQPPARAPYAAPPPAVAPAVPPAVPPVSGASNVVAKSSDGARTKAGSSSVQPPGKPRGTVGMTATSGAPMPSATSSTQLPPVQAAKASQPIASVVGSPSIEPLSQIPLSQEHSVEKAAFDALTVPIQSTFVKRALNSSTTEAARKRPRLVAGELAEWEAEYKLLQDWLDTNLPHERYHSKVGAPLVTCTCERLTELERCWQQLSSSCA